MRSMRAFTLLELMVALAMAAALALVAMSAWQAHFERNRRAAARAALVGTLAQMQLRRAGADDQEGVMSQSRLPQVDGYTIVGNEPCLPPSHQCTMAIAIPHRADPVCGTLSVDSTGKRLPHDAACWP
ncbi:hypothetical protein LMG7141_02964 [Ralstonia condita]|jgi:type IV pilus assembly protein PilE|uniref:Prepilin-type N-terminal cleavage/methylation domain-containing protein n=1 Tax=Ralstonia condita TaxID=3058600 RepID=A0ABN9IVZ4_9RALS|nr:prepilin-type N-terminal cleavage/methylation domain-containing protein [Ralstonia sp. LMG 7141]CAJ0794576.1 hypothetical protein LMG7141_02964 [Ralstonia sp. LMG 7141]